MKIRVLAFSQSAELYGSDKSFLQAIEGLHGDQFEFRVILPHAGPLVPRLESLGVKVEVRPLLKISRSLVSISGAKSFFGALLSRKGRTPLGFRPNLIYTNTIAVLDGTILAKREKIPHLWHVREIIDRPLFLSSLLRFMVIHGSDEIVCNSRQTKTWVSNGGFDGKCHVVWNGVTLPDEKELTSESKNRARAELGLDPDDFVILMAGRINAWKGQDLLVNSLENIRNRKNKKIKIVIAGSAFEGKEHYVESLKALIENNRLRDHIHLVGFQENISKLYQAADISVVPSRLPEPFGRVAAESMAYKLPVIAANHGGLSDIISHEETGILFKPNDQHQLALAIDQTLECDELVNWGQKAQQRVRDLFSTQSYINSLRGVFLRMHSNSGTTT